MSTFKEGDRARVLPGAKVTGTHYKPGDIVTVASEDSDGDLWVVGGFFFHPHELEMVVPKEQPDHIPLTPDMIDYVSRYGGMCRDCADNHGVCPNDGLSCDTPDRHKAIRRVIEAINYGVKHGYLDLKGMAQEPPPEPKRSGRKLDL